MSKLSNNIRLQNATDEVWKIEELLETIKVEMEVREASEGVKTHDGRKPQSSNGKLPIIPTANVLYLRDTRKFHIRYAHCNGERYSASSTEVTESKDRKDIVLKDRRLNCLPTRHQSKDCPSNKKCGHCNGSHHQSICPANMA